MAPEQFDPRHGPVGPWTDLYALGCMAAEWVCGAPPLLGATLSDTYQLRVAGPARLSPSITVPSDLLDWLTRLLDPRTAERPSVRSPSPRLSGSRTTRMDEKGRCRL